MNKPILLHVEDDFVARTMVRAVVGPDRAEVTEAADGSAALEMLEGWRAEDPARPWPALVLLDLGLPGMGGLDVLRAIRGREETRRIPVVIFSSDDQPLVIRTAYEWGANGYVTKPMSAGKFEEAVEAIAAFWLDRNRPPG